MSLLVTVDRFRVITGDTSTDDASASAAIETATDLLSERLGRPGCLKSANRTETVHVGPTGLLRPLAVPVTACAGYTFDTAAVYGASPDSVSVVGFSDDLPRTVTLTYTGGFVEPSANPTAANRLPSHMERDIALAAQVVLAGASTLAPAGAVSVSMGDASVSFGPGGAPGGAQAGISWSRQTLAWRRRHP